MSYLDLENGPTLNGLVYSGTGSVVPYEFLQNITATPSPVSLSSATVTMNASLTNPFPIWIGKQFYFATTPESFTFTTATNAGLTSAGVESNVALATDVWYLYLGLNSSNKVTIYPSQTAPAKADLRFNGSVYGHPGASATKFYSYFGMVICTNSGSPAFVPFTKVGKSYLIPEASKLEQATTDTDYAALAFTGVEGLPTHSGVTVGGYIETSATSGDTVSLAYDASGSGVVIVKTVAAVLNLQEFSNFPLNSGDIYAKHGSAEGDVHITSITDII